jgi:hypothetical protein
MTADTLNIPRIVVRPPNIPNRVPWRSKSVDRSEIICLVCFSTSMHRRAILCRLMVSSVGNGGHAPALLSSRPDHDLIPFPLNDEIVLTGQ